MKCYLFDIDGTLSDLSHRLHHIQGEKKDWSSFFAECGADTPIPHMIDLANELAAHTNIFFVSGRSDQVRMQTLTWLRNQFGDWIANGDLFMRSEGDHRPDNLVKSELLDQILAHGHEPIMAFDDRDQVVKMWRERGVPCAQVADGNF